MKDKRTERLHVLVTPSEKETLTNAAHMQGLTLSAWLRLTLLQVARKNAGKA